MTENEKTFYELGAAHARVDFGPVTMLSKSWACLSRDELIEAASHINDSYPLCVAYADGYRATWRELFARVEALADTTYRYIEE